MRTAAQPPERARSVGRSVVAVNAATPLVRTTENARVLMNRWTGEWISSVSNLSGVGGQSHPTTIDVGSLANPLGQEEPTCKRTTKDAHLHDGVDEVLRLADHKLLLTDEAVGEAVPINDEQVARLKIFEQHKLQNEQVSNGFGSHPHDQADDQSDEEALNDVFCKKGADVHGRW